MQSTFLPHFYWKAESCCIRLSERIIADVYFIYLFIVSFVKNFFSEEILIE